MTQTSDALLAALQTRHSPKWELGLESTRTLLGELGDPHRRLPPTVHIAGTNGKGSTLAMLRAGLSGIGLKVHAYTSPHLVRFNERIVLAGEEISEGPLVRALAAVHNATTDTPVTYFEAITCAAFQAFAETPGDVLLLEVGLGGRGDTTNVIEAPELTVITPVDYDHQAFLGDTLGKIAGEKAGILKRRVPCIVAKQKDEALDAIEARAARLDVPLFVYGQHWHVGTEHGRLVYQDENGLLDLPLPALAGPHQIENAGTAIAALRVLGHGEEAAEAAMTGARWPARMQQLKGHPFNAQAPQADLWLDGGHNPHAAQALADTLRALPPRPTILIAGMLANRDPLEVLSPLTPVVDAAFGVAIPGEPGGLAPDALVSALEPLGIDAAPVADAETALAKAIEHFGPEIRVLFFGSLYFAGAILRLAD